MPRVVVVTGQQASGKSTIGPLLADRLGPPAGSLDGDVFFRMVRAGHAAMTPDADPEAVRQLRLRYEAAARVAQLYVSRGFDMVYTDIITGPDLVRWLDSVTGADRHLVVLQPSAETIAGRELARGKGDTYASWREPDADLVEAIRATEDWFRDTPRRGLWLDTMGQSPEQTVEMILADGMASSRYEPDG